MYLADANEVCASISRTQGKDTKNQPPAAASAAHIHVGVFGSAFGSAEGRIACYGASRTFQNWQQTAKDRRQ